MFTLAVVPPTRTGNTANITLENATGYCTVSLVASTDVLLPPWPYKVIAMMCSESCVAPTEFLLMVNVAE